MTLTKEEGDSAVKYWIAWVFLFLAELAPTSRSETPHHLNELTANLGGWSFNHTPLVGVKIRYPCFRLAFSDTCLYVMSSNSWSCCLLNCLSLWQQLATPQMSRALQQSLCGLVKCTNVFSRKKNEGQITRSLDMTLLNISFLLLAHSILGSGEICEHLTNIR